jgi:hypothetical protein
MSDGVHLATVELACHAGGRGFESRRSRLISGKSGRFAAMTTSRRFCYAQPFLAAAAHVGRGGDWLAARPVPMWWSPCQSSSTHQGGRSGPRRGRQPRCRALADGYMDSPYGGYGLYARVLEDMRLTRLGAQRR